jgi:hypothetical protein
MLNDNNEFVKEEEVLKRLREISTQHMIVAYRAKMTNYEILLCQKISAMGKYPLMHVLEKMAAFKQTSEHILYKKDFILF